MTAKKNEHAEAKWGFKNAVSTAYIIGLITYLGFIIPLGLMKVFNGICGEYSVYDLFISSLRFVFFVDLEFELIIYSIITNILISIVWLLTSQPQWLIVSKCAKYLGVTLVILHTLFLFYTSAIFYFVELLTCVFSIFS